MDYPCVDLFSFYKILLVGGELDIIFKSNFSWNFSAAVAS